MVALMKQARGARLDPITINGLLSSSAHPLGFNATFPGLAPVVQQGGGLVDAYAAMHGSSAISPSSISFNDTRHVLKNASFVVKNLDTTMPQTYVFAFMSAFTSFARSIGPTGLSVPTRSPPSLGDVSVSIGFPRQSVTIGPGGSAAVPIELSLPEGLDATLLPLYSGFIVVKSITSNETYTLPYAGFAADLSKDATIIYSKSYPRLFNSTGPLAANTVFTIPRNISTRTAIPGIATGVWLGTALMDIDLVPLTSTEPLEIGSIAGFPVYYVNGYSFGLYYFTGMMSTGARAPAGNYVLRVRLLKLLGDPNDSNDFESYDTVPFRLQYESL